MVLIRGGRGNIHESQGNREICLSNFGGIGKLKNMNILKEM